MMNSFLKNCVSSTIKKYEKKSRRYELLYKYCYTLKREFSNIKTNNNKKRKNYDRNLNLNMHINSKYEDERDIYFNNKLIEKKIADIQIKNSHNKLMFEYLPIEGRTNNVPIGFKITHYIFLVALSSGVLLIHVLPEVNKESYIRDILTLEIYCCSCFLVFNGGFNSFLQLIQYAIPPNRKYKGLRNSLRFISSLIPLFFGLVSSSLCESFPKDSILLLCVSYITLLLNYYFLHIKCLIPAWMFKEHKIVISVVILNLLLLLISEAQIYRGRKVKIHVDD
ncbi:conserved Plasmodium protein, unknown function [Plasmodium malariae]|uniref:Uncharacterized protein n=1 Tax=Plasmodium malariae TaxID=5858 RepID=A0A1C3L2U6_PLAMA|nr:conserved Plasmodium protein, unknown function [Plasmodium malariae]